MKRKKIISVILVVMVLLLSSIPVMASTIGTRGVRVIDFTLSSGEDEFTPSYNKSAGNIAAVNIQDFDSSYSRDNMYFRVYKTASTAYPMTGTKTINAPYDFTLTYTSTYNSYSQPTYMRGYASAANYDTVTAFGFWCNCAPW